MMRSKTYPSDYRWDRLQQQWVLVAPHRGLSRESLCPSIETAATCPLCNGNEALTAPEIVALRPEGSQADHPGWDLRVIPCPQSLLSVAAPFDSHRDGLHESFEAIGAHELLVDSPDHGASLADLPREHVGHWLQLTRNRFIDLRGDFRLRYFALVKNHGYAAGARTDHPCTHLLALPVPPPLVEARLAEARHYYRHHERCLLCDTIEQELQQQKRIVYDDGQFMVWAPFASGGAFELAIAPLQHQHDFTRITNENCSRLAAVLQQALRRLRIALEDPAWQMVLHTAPPAHRRPGKPEQWHSLKQDTHWMLTLRPCLAPATAMETLLGARLSSVAPEEAARVLRDIHPEG